MITAKEIRVKPVEENTWKDFETLFKAKGSPNYCWCMAWRLTKEELKSNNSKSRKKFIKKRVVEKIPIGLLAYKEEEPIAWCSIAPRETYERLGGDESIEKVWSLACFFILKEYQAQSLMKILISHAKKYAKKNGAKYLEAYPVDPDSPSYRFMGFVATFEKEKFKEVKMTGSRRHVMICKL